ncbi:hypothetical protein Taro_017134 [Colocasia esculenta]|uniref:Uncharacterized protein n=1 Tax=Colocasia esculenta TaxID=4460 RepID=A0A843UFH7_COLES|nr:hypothetical protein [Colocasia esculenta]
MLASLRIRGWRSKDRVLGEFRVSDSWVITVGIRAMSSEIYNMLIAMAIPENSSSALLAPFVVR